MSYRQAPPYCIQVELSEGCNLRCPYCGLNGIRGKEPDFKWMTIDDAEIIAAQIAKNNWNSRIEFAMHGEPTMNPRHVQIIAAFRKHLKKNPMTMLSNGGGIAGKPDIINHIQSMFAAGLNTLGLDEYQNVNLVPKIWTEVAARWDELTFADISIHEYPKDKEGNPHHRSNKNRLVRVAPIDLSTNGTHATLNNHAGAGAPPNDSAEGKRCAKPFREMSIRWNGDIALCCNDWRGVYKCGNVTIEDIEEVWNGDAFQAARKKLYHGQRDFGVCKGCDATSYRPGLLPDHLGKETLPMPSKADLSVIDMTCSGAPYTAPVKRPWESK